MKTRDDWEALLDADPSSMELRFLYADWLEERGEWDGQAVREMAELGLHPEPPQHEDHRRGGVNYWNWWRDDKPTTSGGYKIPKPPAHACVGDLWPLIAHAGMYDTRREAEEDLRRVIHEKAAVEIM